MNGLVGEWTTVDKSEWGPGPWQDEPDKVHWIDPETDLDCLIHRGPGGHWCGYVAVTEGHPAFEQDYDNVRIRTDCPDDDHWKHEPSCYPEVHGGLTFADFCAESHDPATGICHVARPGRPDRVWWLGFDCAHAGDLSPRHAEWERRHGFDRADDHYRDRAYVEAEVRSLAKQLASVEVGAA